MMVVPQAHGLKRVEGRTGQKYDIATPYVAIFREKYGVREVRAEVTSVTLYDTLDDYLDSEWVDAAPHCESKADAIAAYESVTCDGKRVFAPDTRVYALRFRVLEAVGEFG
jgi:ASC-1-like (ASCH) protein